MPWPVIMHVDMDAFFASVELIGRPQLRGRPVVVAGEGRSVVVAATYEARAFGVHSAMPVAQAKRICPQAVFLPPSRGQYSTISRGVMDYLRTITPMIEQVSIDEAFLDLTGSLRRLGPAQLIGQAIRAHVANTWTITCSVGIGRSKSVAKIASEQAKPDGLLEVPDKATDQFLRPLSLSALWGAGTKTSQALAQIGLATIGDLADAPDQLVARAIGPALAGHLQALARGQDDAPVVSAHHDKSIGAETTFDHDLQPGPALRKALVWLVERSAHRLRGKSLVCRTVAVKLRRSDFSTVTRSRSLPQATDSTKLILSVAEDLIGSIDLLGKGVRLIGVRLENLAAQAAVGLQPTFDQVQHAGASADQVSDRIKERFGEAALGPGTLMA
ncbi:MAG: DNA polymerase IV [Micrococcales bacterium]|nr:DNA polymerase IV [Micrococcales bacterium]